MNKRICLRVCIVAVLSLCGSVYATLLDDYSTDTSAQYGTYVWHSSWSNPTFARADEKLVPTLQGSGGGFYWNGGETLKPGDSVSVDFQICADVADANPYRFNLVGLALAKSTGSTDPWRIFGLRYDDASSTPKWHTEGGGTDSTYGNLSESWDRYDRPTRLTLSRGTDGDQNIITFTFEQIDGYGLSGAASMTLPGVSASDALYFATCNYKQNTASYSSWDNLTYIPEPATLSLLAVGGLAMLKRRKW